MNVKLAVALAMGVGLSACAGCEEQACRALPAERLAKAPNRLSETGLYEDIRNDRVAPGVRAYEPQFELWSDGASKRRWVAFPPGSKIDTSDPDFWQFPVGTKFWKEFRMDGVRVETRLLQKTGTSADDWLSLAYIWNRDDSDAFASPDGERGARGTEHNVPAAATCMACHGGTPSRVLGFSAIQLSRESATMLDLLDLIGEDLLTSAPAGPYRVPGSELDREALGYLHANCSHCHNKSRPADGPECFEPPADFELLLRTSKLGAVSETSAYETGVRRGVISPGDAQNSELLNRFEFGQMPPLGTEVVDTRKLRVLERWIGGL